MSTQGQWRGDVDGVWYGPVTAGGPSVVNLSATLTGEGSVSTSISALADLSAALVGSGSVGASASVLGGIAPAETPRYSKAQADHAHWKQLREEDDVILALLQQFVMEEA